MPKADHGWNPMISAGWWSSVSSLIQQINPSTNFQASIDGSDPLGGSFLPVSQLFGVTGISSQFFGHIHLVSLFNGDVSRNLDINGVIVSKKQLSSTVSC